MGEWGEWVNESDRAESDDPLPPAEELNAMSGELGVAEDRREYDGEAGSFDGYKRLRVWHASMEFVAEAYRLSAKLPDSERYGLFSQIRRAAVSAPLNISEG
jgi:hypothetical protein